MNICVFCSSSDNTPTIYRIAAEEAGEKIATRKHSLIFGGGNIGLMHDIAHSAITSRGNVVGVIPKNLREKEKRFDNVGELILTDTVHERKRIMEEKADAFLILPGGFGTLEEFFEVTAMKFRDGDTRPIALFNTAGLFNHLFGFFDFLTHEELIPANWKEYFFISEEIDSILSYFEDQTG
ncbi:MAG: TIGR00730 family Rossman fold protein [Spirochaetia bacterium]